MHTQLQPATRIPPQHTHTETPTHIETRTHDQCGDTIEKSQAPDDGCINVRNMLSVEEVKKLKPLNAELNPICHLLALLEAHHILRVSRLRVHN